MASHRYEFVDVSLVWNYRKMLSYRLDIDKDVRLNAFAYGSLRLNFVRNVDRRWDIEMVFDLYVCVRERLNWLLARSFYCNLDT